MKEICVKIAIIGAGTAGLSAFRAVKKHTDSVVIIEGGPYGTTCARVGCMPSKLLIAAAEAVDSLRKASAFGVNTQSLTIDSKAVMQRVRNERDRFVGFVLDSMEQIEAKYKLRGYARFLDKHTLQIDDHTRVVAERIVIATGSSPYIPPFLKAAEERLVVNDDVFSWQELPKSIAVFGLGVIGLELGQALHRLGVRVTLFGNGIRVGPLRDPELQSYTAQTFSEELHLEMNAKIQFLKKNDNGVEIHYSDSLGREKEEYFEYILAATGRKPNLFRLNLEKAHIKLSERGLPQFHSQTMQIEGSHLFIAGDANNEFPLLHEASHQGLIAGHNAGLYPQVEVSYRQSHLGVVFSDPQIVSVGCLYENLPCDRYVTGKVNFEDQGRSRIILKNKGLLHVYVESDTGLFLGAEMIGPAAEHIGHLLSWAHQQKLTIYQMLKMPFYHPVIEEGVRTALRDAQKKLSQV